MVREVFLLVEDPYTLDNIQENGPATMLYLWREMLAQYNWCYCIDDTSCDMHQLQAEVQGAYSSTNGIS